jgi:hypothetical protein
MNNIKFLENPVIGSLIGFFFFFSLIIPGKVIIKKKSGLFLKSRPLKKCFKCQGFGIIRCTLCNGKGSVFYERKYQRSDPCPKCFQKRYDMCSFCQGSGERTFFGKIINKKFS